jgi:hypothetical protein
MHLLIISIDSRERKYVRIQLKNFDSFKMRSKIFNQNEIDHTMRSKIAFERRK